MTGTPETPPERLYKYTKFGEHTPKLLINSELYFQCPLNFNDPFDCLCYPHFQGTERERRLWCKRFIEEAYPNRPKRWQKERTDRLLAGFDGPDRDSHAICDPQEFARECARHFGLTCFAQNARDILMRSHYGDQHRGVCVEFAPEFFPKDHELGRVQYAEDYATVNLLALQAKGKDVGRRVLLTKSSHWAYEAEWRLFGPVGTAKQFPPESITGVIIGCRATPETISAVADAVAKHPTPVQLYYAHQNPRRYRVDIGPITGP